MSLSLVCLAILRNFLMPYIYVICLYVCVICISLWSYVYTHTNEYTVLAYVLYICIYKGVIKSDLLKDSSLLFDALCMNYMYHYEFEHIYICICTYTCTNKNIVLVYVLSICIYKGVIKSGLPRDSTRLLDALYINHICIRYLSAYIFIQISICVKWVFRYT
jgi:hypothetical protein